LIRRFLFLCFAVASTVATSAPPSWQLEASVPRVDVEIPAGQSYEKHMKLTSSHHATVTAQLLSFAARAPTKLQISLIDSRPGCSDDESYSVYGDDDLLNERTHYDVTVPGAGSKCPRDDEGLDADLVLRVENPSTSPMSFVVDVVAKIGDPNEEHTPAGAHVELVDVP
jgi:hypothetical protein